MNQSINKIKNQIMLKNILNLEGVQRIAKNAQKEINGGQIPPDGECNSYVILNLDEESCKRYNRNYRPMYIGDNQCSIMMAPC
ncbi:hypothetical protein LPB87_08660 [Flavobacterium sp. EDS]|uniref:hypothetical protein n=1 Tax=Flavobacterium sp. EDS TaxID=2897328 RepID=UPI001E2C2A14|nr:hypothetical protein [Flavobacterium sp. EDS]MCD0474467.1 hypothetical protein [Flavobacterium sp. EDS]